MNELIRDVLEILLKVGFIVMIVLGIVGTYFNISGMNDSLKDIRDKIVGEVKQ